jgi:hypothetical protein
MDSRETLEHKRLRAIFRQTIAQTEAVIMAAEEVRRESALIVEHAETLLQRIKKRRDNSLDSDAGGGVMRWRAPRFPAV